MPAPQNGSNSRLLNRTATMFEPARSTTPAKAKRIRLSMTPPLIGG